jgi:profilin
MSWKDHVASLVATGHVSRAAIVGLNGVTWGASSGFNVDPAEAKQVLYGYDYGF